MPAAPQPGVAGGRAWPDDTPDGRPRLHGYKTRGGFADFRLRVDLGTSLEDIVALFQSVLLHNRYSDPQGLTEGGSLLARICRQYAEDPSAWIEQHVGVLPIWKEKRRTE